MVTITAKEKLQVVLKIGRIMQFYKISFKDIIDGHKEYAKQIQQNINSKGGDNNERI